MRSHKDDVSWLVEYEPQPPNPLSMLSPASRHFPPVVFREGRRYLWNRVTRKALENQPEERVRLRFLDYLLLEAGWPKSRVTTETPVKFRESTRPLRADLICYSKELQPEILIECKAESVPLTNAVAEQIARYNHALNASWLCITNGVQEIWFRVEGNSKAVVLDQPPLESGTTPATLHKQYAYWVERGFAGSAASEPLQQWLLAMLPGFWAAEGAGNISFLDIKHRPAGLQLDHFYRLTEIGETKRLALTFLATPRGETCLVGIRNEEGTSSGLFFVNLDRMLAGKEEYGMVITAGGSERVELLQQLRINVEQPDQKWAEELPVRVDRMFDRV
ncbi:MAG: type I restriction enzyme HsdR N-terminal domain-containing protein [Balneolaceae bacterium]